MCLNHGIGKYNSQKRKHTVKQNLQSLLESGPYIDRQQPEAADHLPYITPDQTRS